MSLSTGFSVKVCLFILCHLYAFVTCCCPSKLISTEHKSLSMSSFLCLSSALLLQFEYLMSALPLVTMHYFSALLRAHWLLSLPLTLPGLRPKTDTVSHTAVSHPCSLLHQFLFFVLPPDISVYTVINCTVSCLLDEPNFNFSLILEAEDPIAAELCIVMQMKYKKHDFGKM